MSRQRAQHEWHNTTTEFAIIKYFEEVPRETKLIVDAVAIMLGQNTWV